MEILIKNMRGRAPRAARVENKDDTSRRIPPQKTHSFKGENRKGQNWFRKQFSREMSLNYDDMEGDEFSTAVAAAAFAVSSIEDQTNVAKPKKIKEGPKASSLSEIKSAPEDGTIPVSKFSDMRCNEIYTESRQRRVSFSEERDEKLPERAIQLSGDHKQSNINSHKEFKVEKKWRKSIDSVPSMKNPTFAERLANMKAQEQTPKANSGGLPTDKFSSFPPQEIKKPSLAQSRITESEADVWEKTQMEKIKERYAKLINKIYEWENSKKTKTKSKMARKEMQGELEGRRAKAQRDYMSKVEMIDQIAGGARSQAEENRRNEELKVKEKANKIRRTGKIPSSSTCFCF